MTILAPDATDGRTGRIVDAAGRVVASVFPRQIEMNVGQVSGRFAWDGKDGLGRRVARGVYYFELSGAGKPLIGTITIAR